MSLLVFSVEGGAAVGGIVSSSSKQQQDRKAHDVIIGLGKSQSEDQEEDHCRQYIKVCHVVFAIVLVVAQHLFCSRQTSSRLRKSAAASRSSH